MWRWPANSEARAQALGARRPVSELTLERELGELWGTLVFVDAAVWRSSSLSASAWVSDEEPTDGLNACHPEDLLYAPLRSRDGQLLGTLCEDMPADRLRPGPVQCQLREMFAAHASIAIETSRSLERVRSSEITMRLAFEGAGNPMALVSLDPAQRGRYLRANPELCRLLGRSEEELQGMSVRDDDQLDPDHLAVGSQVAPLPYVAVEFLADEPVHSGAVTVELVGVHDDDGRRGARAAALCDGADARHHRPATSGGRARAPGHARPANRAAQPPVLNERLRESVRLARSIGPGAVLYCDLDGFKAINDAYGHAAGDQVLQTVAERLRRLVRGTDTVYRIGGDEFVVVADGMPVNVCARLAEQIAASLSEPIELDHTSVSVRCSVGTAVLRPGSGDGASALEAADRAMYAVKSGDTHAVRNR